MTPENQIFASYVDRLKKSLEEVEKEVTDYEYKVENLKSFHSRAQIRAWNKKLQKLYHSRKTLKQNIKDGQQQLDGGDNQVHE